MVDASFVSVLSHTLLRARPAAAAGPLTRDEHARLEAGTRVAQDEALLEEALDCEHAAAEPGCAIDDDYVMTALDGSMSRLRAIARASDEHLLGDDGVYTDGTDCDSDGE